MRRSIRSLVAPSHAGTARSGMMQSTTAEDLMADARPTISTHVLDLASGSPAAGVGVALFRLADDGAPELISDAPDRCRRSHPRPPGRRRAHRGRLPARLRRRRLCRRSRCLLPERRARAAHHRCGALVPRPAAAQPVRDERVPRQLSAMKTIEELNGLDADGFVDLARPAVRGRARDSCDGWPMSGPSSPRRSCSTPPARRRARCRRTSRSSC